MQKGEGGGHRLWVVEHIGKGKGRGRGKKEREMPGSRGEKIQKISAPAESDHGLRIWKEEKQGAELVETLNDWSGGGWGRSPHLPSTMKKRKGEAACLTKAGWKKGREKAWQGGGNFSSSCEQEKQGRVRAG